MTSPTVGQALRAARLAAGLSLAEVARQIGGDRGHLCNVEHGRSTLNRGRMALLPDSIREAVVHAAIAEHDREIDKLRVMLP